MLKMENLKKLEEHMEPNHHVCIDWRQLSWHNLKLFFIQMLNCPVFCC